MGKIQSQSTPTDIQPVREIIIPTQKKSQDNRSKQISEGEIYEKEKAPPLFKHVTAPHGRTSHAMSKPRAEKKLERGKQIKIIRKKRNKSIIWQSSCTEIGHQLWR